MNVIPGPLPGAAELDRRVDELRLRYPRATIDRYLDKVPSCGERVALFPGASVIGAVTLANDVSIWPGAVLRGDLAPVEVGALSNIQDGSVLHVGDSSPCIVGAEVVVGHRAVVHGCRVEDGCLIGIQATILDDAIIGQGSIVGAGAVVTSGTVVPPRSLVLGIPGRVVRSLTAADEAAHRAQAAKYARLKENYLRDALRRG